MFRRPAEPPKKEEPEHVRAPMSTALVRAIRDDRISRGLPEVKFFQTTASTGVASQHTWSSYDNLNNLPQGTDQDERLGRLIRIKRMRCVIKYNTPAYTTTVGHILLMRLDPSVSASDLWVTNGSNRTVLLEPNPLCYRTIYSHMVKTITQLSMAAGGTTPSYGQAVHVIDHHFGKGVQVRYDAAGAVIGPSPLPYYCTDESGLTFDVAYQVWFTDE